MKKDVLIYFDLITSLKTTQEVADFISEIDTLMLTFFKPGKISLEKALTSITADRAQKIMQAFSKNDLDIGSKTAVTGFFETLKKLLKKLKIIKLVLAFDPTRKTIANIHNYVKENIGIGYILNIEVSEDLLGGAVIMFDGKYSDYSLKKSIEDTFKTKANEIITTIG